MSKIKPEDLVSIGEKIKKTMLLREGSCRAKIVVHMGTCGIAAGARKVMNTLMALVEQNQSKDVLLTVSSCAGLCSREPMMTIELKGQTPVKYVDLDEEKTKKIFSDHVLGGVVVEEYALAIGSERVG
jgi:NADP-reducing hydrogenase subunit HndB